MGGKEIVSCFRRSVDLTLIVVQVHARFKALPKRVSRVDDVRGIVFYRHVYMIVLRNRNDNDKALCVLSPDQAD